MNETIEHITSLLGRVFLISTVKAFINWDGTIEKDEISSDYDLMIESINYDNARTSVYKKNPENKYLIFFTMSSKIEIFKTTNGFIVCEGLYFNESPDFKTPTKVEIKAVTDISIETNNERVIIFDSTLSSEEVECSDGRKYSNSYTSLKLLNKEYIVSKVEIIVEFKNQLVKLAGIKFD